MFLEFPTGEIELRLNNTAFEQPLAREARGTPAGQMVIVGDGGWDPATLTLRFRLGSNTTVTPGDGALEAAETLLEAAKAATCLREPPVPGNPAAARITYLHGLARARRRMKGTWWEMEITFRPRALDGTRGTGEVITYLGETVTHDDLPVTMELH